MDKRWKLQKIEQLRGSKLLYHPALGKRRASPKLFARVCARLCGAQRHGATALRALALGLRVVALFELLHMRDVRGTRGRQAAGLQLLHQALHLPGVKHGLRERENETHAPAAIGHVGGHVGFERAAPHKHNHRVNGLRRHLQRGLQRLGVLVVLAQRVLEPEAALEDFLRPLGLPLAAKNPTLHIFGFNRKNAKARHDHMVNLRAAVGRGKGDVVQRKVHRLVQLPAQHEAHKPLPDMPLAPRTAQQGRHHHERNHPQQGGHQHVDKRLNGVLHGSSGHEAVVGWIGAGFSCSKGQGATAYHPRHATSPSVATACARPRASRVCKQSLKRLRNIGRNQPNISIKL